jgi:hypothetical protein
MYLGGAPTRAFTVDIAAAAATVVISAALL